MSPALRLGPQDSLKNVYHVLLGPHGLVMPVMHRGDELVAKRQDIWTRYLNADRVSATPTASAPSQLCSCV